MSRPLRIEYPGAFYHITARGNAKQDIFLNENDYLKFLELLSREITQQQWICFAYCLMKNHYHLLIETPEPNLVKGMTRLNGSYTQYFNNTNNRVGHLFQGRYKCILVDKENYFLELCRYVVLNPVRADFVDHPSQWKWNSYTATISRVLSPEFLNSNLILAQFNKNYDTAVESYKKFVHEGIGHENPCSKVKGQIWLGSENFIERVKENLDTNLSKEIPLEQKQPLRPSKEEVMNDILKVYHIRENELINRTNKEAYKTAVYLLRKASNRGIKETAEMFNISEGMVSKIQRQIEQKKKHGMEFNVLTKKYKVQT